MSNLMRKIRWNNRKKMNNRKRWRKMIHINKLSKNTKRDKNHWLTLKRDKLNKTQCFKLWFLSKNLQTPCFKQFIRRSISLRNQSSKIRLLSWMRKNKKQNLKNNWTLSKKELKTNQSMKRCSKQLLTTHLPNWTSPKTKALKSKLPSTNP
jgi:hypothetical protein